MDTNSEASLRQNIKNPFRSSIEAHFLKRYPIFLALSKNPHSYVPCHFRRFWFFQVKLVSLVANFSEAIKLKSSIGGTLPTVRGSPPLWPWRHHRTRWPPWADRSCGSLSGVHVCLFLCFHNVLLVTDSLISEPIANLKYLFTFFLSYTFISL